MNLAVENLFSVKGKVVLVTGGSIGIGAMIAKGFVANGAKVYVSSRKKAACDETARELTAMGPGTCYSIPGDCATEQGVLKIVEELKKTESHLNVLINNAGATWGASFETHPEAAWDRCLNLNVKGVFFMTRACLDLLKAGGSFEDPSRVVVTSSISAYRTVDPEVISYSTSKAAVSHLSRQMANELAQYFITVNVLAPGFVPTKMASGLIELKGGDAVRNANPLKRLGEEHKILRESNLFSKDDLAGTVIWLCSKAGSWINGVAVPIDGGDTVCTKASL